MLGVSRVEFVADRLRRQDAHDRHLTGLLDWHQLQPCEQHRWRRLAQAALDADASWRPGSVNVIR